MSESAPDPINILLIGSTPLLRAGLRLMIEKNPEMIIVGEPKTVTEAINIVMAETPVIIILDFDLGEDKAYDLIAHVRGIADAAQIILLMNTFDLEVYSNAIQLGVKGFVTKEQDPELFVKAITKVSAGEVWLDRAFMAVVIDQISDKSRALKAKPAACQISLLTDREREIVKLVCKALKNRQIAETLHISEATVRHHLTSIFNKLDVLDRFDLILYAFRHSLCDLPQ